MIELILYNLFLSKLLLIIFIITVFIIGCITYWIINKFKLNKGRIKIYGLLLKIRDKDIFILSTIIVRTFLIIYYIIVCDSNLIMSFVMIGIISVIYIILNLKNILYEIINTVSIMSVIYLINILNNYIIEVESGAVQIIKMSLIAFTVMYTIYNLLKDVESVIQSGNNINNDGGKKNEEKGEN